MILLLHILIALSSLLYTAYVFFYPSQSKLRITYIFVLLTIITGSYLAIARPASLTQACLSGLAYLAIIIPALAAVRHKLIRQP